MTTRERTRPALILIAAAAVVLAFGLAWGLGSAVAASESPTPTLNGGSASPAAGGPSTAAGKVVYKVGWTREPDNLNPFIGYSAPAFEIWYLTYDSLVGYDPKTLAPMKGEGSTGLATDWSTSEDGLTWTFTIRQNAKWDDGQPLTAKDIAFTYNYVIQNKMENFTAYTNLIEKATAIDDFTVEFQCSKPKPDMIRSWVPILPEHIWSKVDPKDATSGKYTSKPPYVGSGPFKAVEWKKGSHVHLVANPYWWGPKPKIDEIYFMAYTNTDTLLQDLKAGTVDGGVDLTATQMKQLKSEPGLTARAVTVDGFDDLGFNCYSGPSKGHPVLRDWKFRQALNWAVDRQKIVDLVWGGTTTAGTTIIPPNYYRDPDWHWEPPADVKYTYDPAIANQKLDEAGYPDSDGDGVREYKGKPIELRLIARDESVQSQQTGKLVVGWFKDVGITVKLEVMDEATLGDRELNYEGDVFTPDFDMFLWGWYLDYDPGSMLSYLTKGQIENWNETCWWDPEYEQLYVQQGQELDPAKRKPLIDRMQQMLYEQTPYIVTDYGPDFEAYNTAKWEGYIQIPDPNGNTLLPPFGNGGYANFLSIGPKTAATTESGGSSLGLWVAIAVAAVAVAIVVLLVVLRRRPR
ncbi:MAG: ABC transporter substrate-binding protein, partial [Actinobacteria bacterium]|nr:ABC transporter substrate-binding protein [Actinomycetota bacterium]